MRGLTRARPAALSACAALLFALALVPEAGAAWRAAGDVRGVARRADGVELTLSSGARVAVTFTGPETVRVRLAPGGAFERDFSYAVEPKDREAVRATVAETGGAVEVSAPGGARVRIGRSPFLLTVLDTAGRVVVEDDPARPHSFDPETGAVEASKRRAETEVYYGFGEKAMPISMHGQSLVMWNSDTYAYPVGLDPIYQSIPFFIALREGRAYGLFLDNTHRTYFDMGRREPARYTFGAASGELNYYVFTGGRGRTPREVLGDYTGLTGRTPLPPLWALGYQQSRWSYFPEARVREIARNFRERRIPADVIYLDIDYMDGYRVFTWDKKRFPDPPKLMRDLRAEGFRAVVIVDPGIKVDENYFVYREGREGGFFHRAADGGEFRANVWPGECAFPDFTDPKARAWFGSLYRVHTEEGVAGFWNDMNEPATFLTKEAPQPHHFHHPGKTFPLTVRHAGDGEPGTHARYHNVYGMQMARATFEGLRRLQPGARPFVLTRAGYAGVQRFSAVWTGDNVASWDHLRLSIPMLVNLGVSGVPLVGADVGGFVHSPSGELYARWLQAAALTPLARSHTHAGSKEQDPWSYGPDFERINRASIDLRYRLLPYLYTLFHEHERTGAPPMRPLWFEYPDDPRTYLVEDEYLVGRDLLVAPVVREGETTRRVYFPAGDTWVDWWTGRRYEGGREVEVEAPLERLPLFARAGAAIPVQPVIQHTGEAARVPLTLVAVLQGAGADRAPKTGPATGQATVMPAGKNVSLLYEDAGEGYEHLRGGYRVSTVTLDGNSVRISREGARGPARPLASVVFLGVSSAPREVRAGGRRVERVTFDGASGSVAVSLPSGEVDEVVISP